MPAALIALLLPGLATHAAGDGAAGPVRLFDGESLAGWTAVLDDDSIDPATVWSAAEGVLRCTGTPRGYLRTDREFESYTVTLKWRWTGEPGNNGLLVHATAPNALGVWPRCQEVQLAHENAGDFWVIGTEIATPLEGVPGYEHMVRGRRHLNFSDGDENPPGEWNELTTICRGDAITVLVNGTVVNHGAGSTATRGALCLQSEGAPIEYKEIVLTPLPEE